MQSRLGYKMGRIYSAADSHGPLANPPGVIFPLTQAGLQRTPPESAADPKICGGFASDPQQVRGGAVDLFAMERNFSLLVIGELVFAAD